MTGTSQGSPPRNLCCVHPRTIPRSRNGGCAGSRHILRIRGPPACSGITKNWSAAPGSRSPWRPSRADDIGLRGGGALMRLFLIGVLACPRCQGRMR